MVYKATGLAGRLIGPVVLFFFLRQKQMYPLAYCFAFGNIIFFAVVFKAIQCLLVEAYTETLVDGIVYLWTPGPWAHIITSLLLTPLI